MLSKVFPLHNVGQLLAWIYGGCYHKKSDMPDNVIQHRIRLLHFRHVRLEDGELNRVAASMSEVGGGYILQPHIRYLYAKSTVRHTSQQSCKISDGRGTIHFGKLHHVDVHVHMVCLHCPLHSTVYSIRFHKLGCTQYQWKHRNRSRTLRTDKKNR